MSSIQDPAIGSGSEQASLSNDGPSPPHQHHAPYTAQETAEAWGEAESQIFPRDEDADSGYDDDMASLAESMSLASSAWNFAWENGRRYHGYQAGKYNFPNDDKEQDREIMKHTMFLKLFNEKMHFAPLDKEAPLEVLDIGTGTGSWAIDCS